MKRRFQSAFSLVELVVVIAIIGVLASISIIGSVSIQRATRDDARKSQATVVSEALEKYYQDKNEYPSVAALTPPRTINNVKDKLGIKDVGVLTFPTVTAGTSALVASSPTPARLTYVGTTVDQTQAVVQQCQQAVDGYCDAYALQYVKESDNNTVTITSRHNAEYAITDPVIDPFVLSPPTQPAVSGAGNYSSVTFTASSASCSVGSVQYKIRYNTTSSSVSSMPDWSTVSWSATTTRTINPGGNSNFYSQSLARCVSGAASSVASAESVVDHLYVAPQTFAPGPITPSASLTSPPYSAALVSWTAVTGTAPITYTVKYGTSPGTYGTTACTITTTSCQLTGLSPSTTYYIQVTASNNTPPNSVGTTAITTSAIPCSTVPSAPTSLNASPTASVTQGHSIQVSWGASSTPANCSAPTYTVRYGTSPSPTTVFCTGSSTSCNITGLALNTTYYISVTPANEAGNGPAGNTNAKPTYSINITGATITPYSNLRINFQYNGDKYVSNSPTACAISGTAPNYLCLADLAVCTNNQSINLTDNYGATATSTAQGVSAPTGTPNPTLVQKYGNGFKVTWADVPGATYYPQRVTYGPDDILAWEKGRVDDTLPPASPGGLQAGRTYKFWLAAKNCAGQGPTGFLGGIWLPPL